MSDLGNPNVSRNRRARAELRAWIDANGPADLEAICAGLHWESPYAAMTISHAIEAGVLSVIEPKTGKRRDRKFAAGFVQPRFAAEPRSKKIAHPERIAPPSFLHQRARDELAEIERRILNRGLG